MSSGLPALRERGALVGAVLLGLSLLAGPAWAVEEGEVRMPAGLDMERLKLVEQGQQMRVYVSLLGHDDKHGGNVVYPGEAGVALGSVAEMNRRFMDMVSETRRFQVFDDTDTGIREESDIVITGQVTRASQYLERFLRGRKAVTSVGLSIQIKNSQNGSLLDQHQVIENFGQIPGEGALALAAADVGSAEFKQKMNEDYQEAFTRALEHAAAYFESSMRPMARITSVRRDDIHLNRGTHQGLQVADEFVLFSLEQGRPRPLALARCNAVGSETSVCTKTRHAPDADNPQAGHYAILSDQSLKLRFE